MAIRSEPLEVSNRKSQRSHCESKASHPCDAAVAVLSELVFRLSQADEGGAAELLADQGLVARAQALGLGSPQADRPWSLAGSFNEVTGPFTIMGGSPLTISFVEVDDTWLISDVRSPD